MGTYYALTFALDDVDAAVQARLRESVDSLLASLNDGVNHYLPNSLISRFNRGDTIRYRGTIGGSSTLATSPEEHFFRNVELSLKPVALTGGAFDPTVGPLVEYYGFGPTATFDDPVEPDVIDSLLRVVGYDQVAFDSVGGAYEAYAKTRGVRLNFSAIAKGYGVDQVFLLLRQRTGNANVFVEIGGETRASGVSPRGTSWTVGVNRPDPRAGLSDLVLALALDARAVASSGNYRNSRLRDGRRYVHTVDPRTGRAEASALLSASVLAPTCAEADAYATACMVVGEGAPEVLAKAGLDACLIFADTVGTGYDVRYVGDFERFVREPQSSTQAPE